MKLKNRKWNRILKLADFMEKLPRRRFRFSHYVGEDYRGASDLSCGTTACAIGWATTIPLFRRLGLKMRGRGLWAFPTLTGFDSGHIFGVDRDVLGRLFYPGPECMGKLPGNATPKQWARHARKIVKELNEHS